MMKYLIKKISPFSNFDAHWKIKKKRGINQRPFEIRNNNNDTYDQK